ncbi:MAG: hypothetical protein A2651_04100 [Candidatus Yanofskybacteria bacterium RIFCSPHIGHO2_01_FULL_42_12]|uniref:Penicillin-binding protein transpeptidase domain-containing protein n=1 Tax=Candidatus Yanofskybacteria bacterium RIFCSPLOWO2_01_FULL_42_49 TaxID=1802694 RepID=A0A1F8GBT8_9BACT|nr:MAG: hypothetical protein A2651_04100 [Candidatus Yanofskybacteria bacterium RIFCSPHIGHO2_01_FULL_42_12]OGN22500.1 MAG: hypothetical protein A2918_01930 [Candidatus Yanofskybacteria bacterium RIFCSPLOWO2_01_FULL_42_49]
MAKHDNFRINLYFIFVLAAAAVISYNLFILTYIKHRSYSLTAEAQSQDVTNVLARGNIYLRNEKVVHPEESLEYLAATNKKFPLAYLVPIEIDPQRSEEVADKLNSVLAIDKIKIKEVIDSRSSNSRVVARKINNEQVESVKSLKTKGVGVVYETDRFYPGNQLGASVLGFLGYGSEGKSGQYGVESFYNEELFGKRWSSRKYFNGFGVVDFIAGIFKNDDQKNNTGDDEKVDRPADLLLSIDKNIQQVAEDKLDLLMKKLEAAGGTVIVQDPNTGKILAMADRPTFNPNSYSEYEPRNFLNKGVQEVFEPGSSFKPITMAMGLDLGMITPQTTFSDVGFRDVAEYRIKNFSERIFGTVTMSQVLEKSINTGAMHVQDLVGDDNFLSYMINFGFGQRTGVDLPGEVNGDISNLYSGRKINFLTASFGQGVAVTPIQLINAYSVIANGGKLMKPYVVEKIIKEGGREKITEPEIVSIPISEKTAGKLKSMLVSVVDNGFDKARINGYDVAGKTGTAQIPDGKGGYLENEYIHDFVGFAPAFDAKFVILIKVDKPKGITFAADSLSPTFKEITQYLLNYYEIPPTRR